MRRLLIVFAVLLGSGCAPNGSRHGARGVESAASADPDESTSSDALTQEQRLELLCCAGLFTSDGLSAEARQACAALEALGPVRRSIDEAPHISVASPVLPAGEVRASFWLNTGGDQMACRRVEAGLGVTVRVGARQYTQQFASCEDAGHGSAIASAGALDSAGCDGRYFDLVVQDDAVVVREGQDEVVRIPRR